MTRTPALKYQNGFTPNLIYKMGPSGQHYRMWRCAPASQTDASGNRPAGELYTYDAFGNMVTGNTSGQPFRYTGRRWDDVHAVGVSMA